MCRRWGVEWTIVMNPIGVVDAAGCGPSRLIGGQHQAFRWDHRQQNGSSSYEGLSFFVLGLLYRCLVRPPPTLRLNQA
eukprot:3185437-Prymnesium_polylepis.1